MAVVRSANVISLSADGDVATGPLRTDTIAVQAGGAGVTLNLRKGSVAGAILYSIILAANGNTTDSNKLRVPVAGVYLQITAGAATVFLYSS